MKQINIHQAKTHLSKLVERAAQGEEIVIAKAGKPLARLTAYVPAAAPRRAGKMRGQIRIKKNFDAPLPEEVLAYFDSGKP